MALSITKYREYKEKGNRLIRKLGFEHEDVIKYFQYLDRLAKGENFAFLGLSTIYKKHFKKGE